MNERALFLYDTSGMTVTVYIRGEIDHHTAVSVRNGIDAMLFEKRPAKLILDLSAVGFMDSSGLGLIMGRLSVMTSLGGEMAVRNPGREVGMILKLAGMERLIPIEYADDAAAVSDGADTGVAASAPQTARRRATPKKAPTKGGATGGGAERGAGRGGKRIKKPTTSA